MRSLVLLGVLLATPALADELPSNSCLGTLRAGDSCLTDDGTSGTCVEEPHSYVDNLGKPVTYTELICVAAVTGSARTALPWLGAALAFLALCGGLATRRRPALPG